MDVPRALKLPGYGVLGCLDLPPSRPGRITAYPLSGSVVAIATRRGVASRLPVHVNSRIMSEWPKLAQNLYNKLVLY